MLNVSNLFRKKETQNELYAMVDGKETPLEQVNDEAFSQKMMGDGVAVEPSGNSVYAPCDGVLSVVFPTGHAFGIQRKDGVEILVHIGLDTVSLKGEGFTIVKRQGDKVKRGEKIIEMDLPFIKENGLDPTTILLLTETNGKNYMKFECGNVTHNQDVLISLQ